MAQSTLTTIEVLNEDGERVVINEADFDSAKYRRIEAGEAPAAAASKKGKSKSADKPAVDPPAE